MTDSIDAAVFTNDAMSQDTRDLLQKAIQQVIDDDNKDSQFVTLLHPENSIGAITLTPEQAAALGYTYENDTEVSRLAWNNEINDSITDKNSKIKNTTNIKNNFTTNNYDYKPQIISQQGIIKVLSNFSFQNWNAIHNIDSELTESFKNQNIAVKIKQNSNEANFKSTTYVIKKNDNKSQVCSNINSNQPVLKSTQNLTKNVRILPNLSKIDGHNLKTSCNEPSFFVQKTALINTMPSIIRAIPVSNLSLDVGPQPSMLTDSLNQQISNSNLLSVSRNSQLLLPQLMMTTANQEAICKNTEQSFIAPNLKKSGKINCRTDMHKPLQIAPKIIGSTSTTITDSKSLTTKVTKEPIIFQTSIIKDKESKIGTISQSHNNSTSNTPVSLLKSTNKIFAGDIEKQVGKGWKGTINNMNNGGNKHYGKILNLSGPIHTACIKPKHANENNSLLISSNAKSNFDNPGINSAELETKCLNINKLSNSGEQVIQITQQGQTLHGLQQLSSSQLKQIVSVLQTRSQNNEDGSEKVVYRVVFPEDLNSKNRPPNNALKNRISKRGRPRKGLSRNSVTTNKSLIMNEENDDVKNERKKVVARTRSGRLSRPPRHMVRDYKHLHHLDFMQPDYDDSDGGYSDYNTQSDKIEDDDTPKELLTGLEIPKRKISDHFRCPTCNKIYLGRTRMSRHFEAHPDHGSPEHLLPPSPDPELKQISSDPLKRKGKKRGPWAYVTPEAKSERRQIKLKEAISVCDNSEIIKIAAKPVINAQSLYNLLVLKSEMNVKTFFKELKILLDDIKSNVRKLLSSCSEENEFNADVIDLKEKHVCDIIGVKPGFYKINDNYFNLEKNDVSNSTHLTDGPLFKKSKLDNIDNTKNTIEQPVSGASENADVEILSFLHKRKPEVNCPEVLSALTLIPRNTTSLHDDDSDSKSNTISKLLISSPEIQNQISDSSGFKKIDISSSPKNSTYQKFEPVKEEVFSQGTNCSDVFSKFNYDSNAKVEHMEQGFIKLDVSSYHNIQDDIKLSEKIEKDKLLSTSLACKIPDIMQETAQIITSNCDSTIFGNSENLSSYEHITHLDILNISGVIDKNLMIDDKLVEHLNLVEQSNIVDELVSERIKTIISDNILDRNITSNHTNEIIQHTDLDFNNLNDEFNRSNKR